MVSLSTELGGSRNILTALLGPLCSKAHTGFFVEDAALNQCLWRVVLSSSQDRGAASVWGVQCVCVCFSAGIVRFIFQESGMFAICEMKVGVAL